MLGDVEHAVDEYKRVKKYKIFCSSEKGEKRDGVNRPHFRIVKMT